METSGEDISKAQANKFLKQKVLEHTEVAPGKMSKAALQRQTALMESKKRTRQKYAAKWTEAKLQTQYEELERRDAEMTGKVNILIDRIDAFDESESAYKVSRMEITRKAKRYTEERNARIKARDRNF